VRIAIVAPSCTFRHEAAEAVQALSQRRGDCELLVHPQCFLNNGHFAGTDAQRLAALREVMADPAIDAVWFARGGYGSNRIAEQAMAELPKEAFGKEYMGYSDAGFLLAAFDRCGLRVTHGPMPSDIMRGGGDQAVDRALDWLVARSPESLEPGLGGPAAAFNLTVLSTLLGTAVEPDLRGMELLIEEVSEHHYRIDRLMFHLTASANTRAVKGIRLGRCSDIPDNDPVFGSDEEEIVRDWCGRSGIPFLGRADIGHDSANRVVPFGEHCK
jgi:muramoyltetrapeptide carboxypeptidase